MENNVYETNYVANPQPNPNPTPTPQKRKSRAWLYILIFFFGCAAMYAIVYFFPTTVTENITRLEKDVTVTDTGIADAVEKIYDAVVIVSTYQKDVVAVSGTGFIYEKNDNEYLLLTNYHVIEGGDKVTITMTSGEIIETKVVGYNEYEDIAILSFESDKEYVVAQLGDSEASRVGDTTFAVGAPLESTYSWTVTRGIISGKDRMVEVSVSNTSAADYVMKVLQTDTAINSGNSGGPLCNSNGEVIGITSLKLVSDGIEGMGFAIPIERALDTVEKIISGESFETPYLGIGMYDVAATLYTPQFADLIQAAGVTSGVIITSVEKNSPADKAGLQFGDIIVSMNEAEINNIAYLRFNLYSYKKGDEVTISYYRNGKLEKTKVTIGTNAQVS